MQSNPSPVLQNLRLLHENPPSLNVSISAEVQNSLNDMSKQDLFNRTAEESLDMKAVMDGIDWNISVDDSQIDWNIDAVEQTEESGNGFGSYEIINPDSEFGSDNILTENKLSNITEEGAAVGTSESEVCWDIGTENSQVAAVDNAGMSNAIVKGQLTVTESAHAQILEEERSQLLETDYRNSILDDLFEVHGDISGNLCASNVHSDR